MLEAAGDSITSPPAGYPFYVMPYLTGRSSSSFAGNDMADLTNALNAGKLVCADTKANSTGALYYSANMVSSHAYMVEDIHATAWATDYYGYESITYATDWAVDLYNPWGYNVTVSWSEFSSSVDAINTN
jgi:hypothetical protein